MKYNLNNIVQANEARQHFNKLLANKKDIELKEIKETRSSQQNRSLHLLFTFISNELNEIGLEFQYSGLNDNTFNLMYTPHLVKEFVWRPIQIALFDIESTTKINTEQINQIVDVLVKFFGEQGVEIVFPSLESLIEKEMI